MARLELSDIGFLAGKFAEMISESSYTLFLLALLLHMGTPSLTDICGSQMAGKEE